MFDKILIPYDGSMASEQAYALAIDLAEKYGSTVFVMTIARPPEPAVRFRAESYLAEVREYYKERFTALGRRAGAKGVKVRFEIRVGHPAELIVHVIRESEIDLVIVGRRGRSIVQGWPLGTVSERILTHANCAVLAVA